MARAAEHDRDGDLQAMAASNIIVRLSDTANLRELKDVLYQIRCNVFHGEKVPGDINDDRIVKAATPILQAILATLMNQDAQA